MFTDRQGCSDQTANAELMDPKADRETVVCSEYHTAMRTSEGEHTSMEGGTRTCRSDTEEDTPQDCVYVGWGTGDRGGALATESDDPGARGRGGIGCAGLLGAAGSASAWRPPHQSAREYKMFASVSRVPQAQGSLSP